MSFYFTLVLALLSLSSQVSGFGYCDPAIILNIENFNLTAFPAPKIALFSNQRFKYDYVSSTDKDIIQSADIVFNTTSDNKTLSSTFSRYLYGSTSPTSVSITFTDIGDDYEVNAKGFIDSPTSLNQVYIWQVKGVVVAYYCSLNCGMRCKTGGPLFALNTPINNCTISAGQLQACQNSINQVSNNVAAPLAKLKIPPTSKCK